MAKEQFEATRGNQYADDDVVAGNCPYKVGDALSYLHDSQENCYLIKDYPYGRQLRTLMRVWYEHDLKKGTRFVAQTQDPKSGRWNNPKKSTYSKARVERFDAEGHLVPEVWTEYRLEEAGGFYERNKDNLPTWALETLCYVSGYNRSMEESKKAATETGQKLEWGTPGYAAADKIAKIAGAKAVIDAGLIERKD